MGTGDFRNPIAFLVEASDDIVYSTVDLEDGVKKGVITWQFIEDELIRQAWNARHQHEKELWTRRMKKLNLAGLETKGKRRSDGGRFSNVRYRGDGSGNLQSGFEKHYRDIMSGNYHRELLYDSAAGKLASACKQLGSEFVYVSGETLKLELMGRKVISDLLTCFWEAAHLLHSGKEAGGLSGEGL